MGRMRNLEVIALFVGASVLAAAPAQARGLSVHIDENTIVDLRAPAGSVIVGNPSIADVNLINPRRMVILGRSYGLTNIIVTDRMGRAIFHREINVAAAPTGRVSLYRGPLVNNYACTPHCERTPMPGEDKSVYDPSDAAFKDYGERSKAEAGTQSGPSGSP